jgi:hypothetical protein
MAYKKMGFLFFKINYGTRIHLFFLLFLGFQSTAQTEKENQFTNEYQFNRVIGTKTAIEFNLAHAYTSGINETNPFYKSSQIRSALDALLHSQKVEALRLCSLSIQSGCA